MARAAWQAAYMDKQQRRAVMLTALVMGGGIWFLYLVGGILLPFLVGIVLAYLLDPVVGWVHKQGLPRGLAAALPVTAAVTGLVLLLTFGLPVLIDQLSTFIQRLPIYVMTLQHFVLPEKLSDQLNLRQVIDNLLRPLSQLGMQSASWALSGLKQTVSGVAWLFNLLLLVVMTPLVAFYLLVEWPGLMKRIPKELPRPWRGPFLEVSGEIHVKLAAYLRGVFLVCVSLGVFYALGLELVGPVASLMTGKEIAPMELGWAIGLLTGLLGFLPIVGATIGVVLMMGMALVQYQLLAWEPYALIVGLFVVGQVLEGYVLTPNLVGNRVGLHPLWVMFALLAGGSLGGIGGMLMSIPCAVVVSVILPRVLRSWREAF